MTGNVKLPGVSKEEFRRMLMFANSKGVVRSWETVPLLLGNLFKGVLPCELAGCVGLYYKKRQ